MKKFTQRLIDAFRPASLDTFDRLREFEAAEDRWYDRQLRKKADESRRLIEKHLKPVMTVLMSLPEKDGKKFWMKPDETPPDIYYGNSKDSRAFLIGTARKTILGNVRYGRIRGFEEISQKEMAQELAAWVRDVAPDRVEEVQNALRRNDQARSLAPKI